MGRPATGNRRRAILSSPPGHQDTSFGTHLRLWVIVDLDLNVDTDYPVRLAAGSCYCR